MLEGLLMKHAAATCRRCSPIRKPRRRWSIRRWATCKQAPPDQVAPVQRFLGELKTFMGTPQSQGPPGSPQGEWQPLKITKKDVARVCDGPRNPFDITFPQGVIWGLIGCAMSFGISLVTERTHGTLVRLRMAPLTNAQILGGKALSCFAAILFVEVMLLGVALAFGVRPTSYAMLALAGLSAAICFVGFMMLVASLGQDRTDGIGRGLGDPDAAVDDRRRDGADIRDAGVDPVDQFHQPDPLDDAGDRRRRVAQLLDRRNGDAVRDPDLGRHRLLRDRHARTERSVDQARTSGPRRPQGTQGLASRYLEPTR